MAPSYSVQNDSDSGGILMEPQGALGTQADHLREVRNWSKPD
jgi:hypothetical protein